MSDALPGADAGGEAPAGRRPPLRLLAKAGAPPLGAILGGIGLFGGLAVSFLHLDRLPFSVCVFKNLTGLPCPTCGSTRAVGRLFAFDLAGALAMNPLTSLGVALIAVWAVGDLLLLVRGRALAIEVEPRLAARLRITLVLAFALNWIYLLAARR